MMGIFFQANLDNGLLQKLLVNVQQCCNYGDRLEQHAIVIRTFYYKINIEIYILSLDLLSLILGSHIQTIAHQSLSLFKEVLFVCEQMKVFIQ